MVRAPAAPPERRSGEVRRGDAVLSVTPWGEHGVSTYRGELSPIQGWYAPEFGLEQKNHVWALCFEGDLPTWMGYVLWPEDVTPTVQTSLTSDGLCRVTVQAGSDLYDISINRNNVILETQE